MTKANQSTQKGRRWVYPITYLVFLIIFVAIPVYAEKPYAQQETQDVIINLLMIGINPYKQWAPIFHVGTLLVVGLIAAFPNRMGRALATYIGLNYLLIASVQTMGTTAKYGFVIHTSALVGCVLLGVTWIVVAIRGGLAPSFQDVPWSRYLFLPLAFLAFWSPYNADVQPDFNPLLLLTSPDYGLTFCMTTPVFLFLLILFYPKISQFAFKITAFNGLLYGLVNMTHFFNPDLQWMGVLHLPLLTISLYAMILPRTSERQEAQTA